ncbi:MAG: peptide deformylase [Deltaproteobacteria bacterium]|nr:peptide deformylase [Deltaproteobacteria bacterium]
MLGPRLLAWLRACAGLAACGCAGAAPAWSPAELALLGAGSGPMPIVKLDLARPDPASVLRQRALPVRPGEPALAPLAQRMRATLEETGGVGLAAPQVGVSRRVVLVRLGTRPAGQGTHVEIFVNPTIDWSSDETDDDYEACLSIDAVGGLVRRPRRVRLSFDAPDGDRRRTIALDDWDARIVQHELDHLEGVLFVDRLLGALLPLDEMRRRRDEGHRRRGWLPAQAAPGP